MHLSPVLEGKSLSVAMFIFSKREQSQEIEETKHL